MIIWAHSSRNWVQLSWVAFISRNTIESEVNEGSVGFSAFNEQLVVLTTNDQLQGWRNRPCHQHMFVWLAIDFAIQHLCHNLSAIARAQCASNIYHRSLLCFCVNCRLLRRCDAVHTSLLLLLPDESLNTVLQANVTSLAYCGTETRKRQLHQFRDISMLWHVYPVYVWSR